MTPVIVDTDIDDTWALAMLLRSLEPSAGEASPTADA